MNRDKAIEILTDFTFASNRIASNDVNDAIQLGIEALKRVELTRQQHLFQCWILLPGETED